MADEKIGLAMSKWWKKKRPAEAEVSVCFVRSLSTIVAVASVCRYAPTIITTCVCAFFQSLAAFWLEDNVMGKMANDDDDDDFVGGLSI
jgi:poly(A) polymerase Pap1